MKVYAAPEHIQTPAWPSPFNHDQYSKNCDAYRAEIRKWLSENGYTGEYSGEVIQFGVADGYAQYMLADGGRRSFLIHLDEVDGYQYRDVEFLPKREIIKRIEQQRKFKEFWNSKQPQ